MKNIRISRLGFILSSLYVGLVFACVVLAQFISDPKGQYIILQLPVVLQHGLLLATETTSIIKDMSWPYIYLTLGTPMLVLLVFFGNIIETIFRKIFAESAQREPETTESIFEQNPTRSDRL